MDDYGGFTFGVILMLAVIGISIFVLGPPSKSVNAGDGSITAGSIQASDNAVVRVFVQNNNTHTTTIVQQKPAIMMLADVVLALVLTGFCMVLLLLAGIMVRV